VGTYCSGHKRDAWVGHATVCNDRDLSYQSPALEDTAILWEKDGKPQNMRMGVLAHDSSPTSLSKG